MKRTKLEQIRRIREQTKLLRLHEHARACPCCTSDLDQLDEAADSPHATVFLQRVVRRCEERRLAAQAAPRRPLASDTPPEAEE